MNDYYVITIVRRVLEGGPSWSNNPPQFDAARVLPSAALEHVRIDHVGYVCRLDTIQGSLMGKPELLRAELDIAQALPQQVITALALRDLILGSLTPNKTHDRLAASLLNLWAWDARTDGASLREIADLLMGEGDWPGDGEHRKSRVRRMLPAGQAMVEAGPQGVMK